MFYCEPCGHTRGWPEGLMKSVGPCEMCGTRALCSDVPSKYLPEPSQSVESIWGSGALDEVYWPSVLAATLRARNSGRDFTSVDTIARRGGEWEAHDYASLERHAPRDTEAIHTELYRRYAVAAVAVVTSEELRPLLYAAWLRIEADRIEGASAEECRLRFSRNMAVVDALVFGRRRYAEVAA